MLLAGVPSDFRLDYGNHIRRGACLVAANRSPRDAAPKPPARRRASSATPPWPSPASPRRCPTNPTGGRHGASWSAPATPSARPRSPSARGKPPTGVNPVALCREIAHALPPDTVFVADGGDFVATASYILRPDGPLRWLDPGVFGTLGVGAGFALGAALVRPHAPVWIVFGDGAIGYGLTEFDTFVRHGIPVIAVVGNDACWSQIAREQIHLLHDDVGTVLAPTRYDHIASGFGAVGLHVDHADHLPKALATARTTGQPVLVDVRIGRTDFRKDSISM